MSIRTERVASVIKHEIGTILTRELNDPRNGFITVTDVRMTPDLRVARVAFSVFGDEKVKQRAMKMLNDEKPQIRSTVGSHLRLRYTPALEFFLDETMESADRIHRLLKQIHDGEKPKEADSESDSV